MFVCLFVCFFIFFGFVVSIIVNTIDCIYAVAIMLLKQSTAAARVVRVRLCKIQRMGVGTRSFST